MIGILVFINTILFVSFTDSYLTQHFLSCNGKFNSNTSTVQTFIVSSVLQCCRQCHMNENCLGVNVFPENQQKGDVLCKDILIENDNFIDPCLYTVPTPDTKFYYKEQLWYTDYKILETDTDGNVIYGSLANVTDRLERGESFRVMLKNFKDSYDILVNTDSILYSGTEVCAQSLFNLEWTNGDIHRTMIHICVSGTVEVQEWRNWANELTNADLSYHTATVWYTDGLPKEKIVSLGETFVNVENIKTSIENGSEIFIYSSGSYRPFNSIFFNESLILVQHPWEVSISKTNGLIFFKSDTYWFSTIWNLNGDYGIIRWYIESDTYMSSTFINNRKYGVLLDNSWARISNDSLDVHVNSGNELRVVFDNRAEKINFIRNNTISGVMEYAVDRLLESTDGLLFDSSVKLVFIVLTPPGKQTKYIFDAGQYTPNYTTTGVTLDWFSDGFTWTQIHFTPSAISAPGIGFYRAFNNGRRFRIRMVIDQFVYFFTADNIRKIGDMFMASYYGFGFNIDTHGKNWLVQVWTNGTIVIIEKSVPSASTERYYEDVTTTWFVN